MKHVILIFTSCLCYLSASSQTNDYPGVYAWTEIVQMTRCDIHGLPNGFDQNPVSSIVKQKFVVIQTDPQHTSNLIIKLLYYNPSKPLFAIYNVHQPTSAQMGVKQKNTTTQDYGNQQIYFTIPLIVFQKYSIKYSVIADGLAFGAINYPFKYRLQQGNDFSGSFNLGAGVGYVPKHDSLNRFFITFLLGFSISNINLDSSAASQNFTTLHSTNNFSALTLSLGTLVEANRIQVGVFVGFDRLSKINQQQYGWKYQGNPWLSIGIGYSIFSSAKGTSSGNTKTQNGND